MSASTARAAGKRYTYEWYVVVICMLAYVFSFVDRQVLVLMIEPIKRDLHLSDTQFSLLNGFAFSLFYAVMGLPVAYLADRYARPRIISLGIALWSVATAACGLSQHFVQMFIARMGVGGRSRAVARRVLDARRLLPEGEARRAIAVYSLGSFIGGGVAFLIGGYVIALLACERVHAAGGRAGACVAGHVPDRRAAGDPRRTAVRRDRARPAAQGSRRIARAPCSACRCAIRCASSVRIARLSRATTSVSRSTR